MGSISGGGDEIARKGNRIRGGKRTRYDALGRVGVPFRGRERERVDSITLSHRLVSYLEEG